MHQTIYLSGRFLPCVFKHKNRSELEEDDLKSLTGKETKEFLVGKNILLTNKRGNFGARQ